MREIQEDEGIRILGGSHWYENNKPVETEFAKSKQTRALFSRTHRGILYILSTLFIIGLLTIVVYSLFLEKRFYGFEYPITRQQEEVLASLQNSSTINQIGITYSTDSYLGVELKIYKIEGLKAELCDSFPSLNDKNVYFVTRSSDYRFDGNEQNIIGDYVRNGELLSKSNWRAGYLAILNGNAEIGIGRHSETRSYLLANNGSMFRQFALVSAGVKCLSQYILKGKVTRCAYARTLNNDLYFIETVHPETLYGFSDALIEFGFVDAIYVTGGSQQELFYRDRFAVAHGNYEDDKTHQMVVWKRHLH